MSLGEEELQLKKRIHVPLMIERLTLYGPVMSDTVYVVNTIKHKKDGFLSFDAAVLSHTGEQLAELKNASVKEVLQPNRLENASLPRPGIKTVRKRKENRWILPLSGFPASIRRPMISMRFGKISNKERIVLPKFRKTAGNGNITFPRTGRRRERSTANGADSLTGSPILILSSLRFPP